MSNQRIHELLAKKLAGEASQAELDELHQLVLKYPESIYYLEAFDELWKSDNQPEDTDSAFARHQLKFAADFELPQTQVRPLYKRYWYVAASIMVISIAAALLFYLKSNTNLAASHFTQIVSGKSIRKKLLLPDGTEVWLNADSRIAFDSDMQSKNTREVNLTGEAFFDVAHDKKHPFIIHTDKIAIKVLGTAFNVKAYPKDPQTEATLLRGMIELTVNDRPEQKIILKPNEKFNLTENPTPANKNNNTDNTTPATMLVQGVVPVTIGSKTYTEEVAWTQDQLVFHDETLEELKPRLERWFNVKINLEAGKLNTYTFTGSFKNETITQALKAMQSIKPFNFKISADEVNIY